MPKARLPARRTAAPARAAQGPARPPAPRPGATRHVALLRGVNVGGKHALRMADLAAHCRSLGCGDPETFIQSGNVLFHASPALARRLPAALAAALLDRHGLHAPVTVRSAAELEAVVRGNPFLAEGADPKELYVVFLAGVPTAAAVASLEPDRSPPDELLVRGREVYLRLRTGAAKTRITSAWLDARLGTVGTARNWNTVTRLAALAAG